MVSLKNNHIEYNSMEKNKYIEPENYWAGYQESIKEFRNNPELVAFDKLCYELFEMNELGRKFIEIVKERYLIPSLASLQSVNYQHCVIWADGFKEAYRTIINASRSHGQRILAETNKNV